MVNDSVVTEEMRMMIGVEFGPYNYDIEKGAIKKVAKAIDDLNPLWQDEKKARNSRYQTIIAPPTFLFSLRIDEILDRIMLFKCPLKRMLNGGSEIEYFHPIRPGDVITVSAKIKDIFEREGSSGRLLFMPIEVTYTNQKGDLVAKHILNILRH